MTHNFFSLSISTSHPSFLALDVNCFWKRFSSHNGGYQLEWCQWPPRQEGTWTGPQKTHFCPSSSKTPKSHQITLPYRVVTRNALFPGWKTKCVDFSIGWDYTEAENKLRRWSYWRRTDKSHNQRRWAGNCFTIWSDARYACLGQVAHRVAVQDAPQKNCKWRRCSTRWT